MHRECKFCQPLPARPFPARQVHQGALGLALRDVQAAGMPRMARLHHGECRAWALPRPPTLVVSNPPWGQRLLGGERDEDGSYDSGSSEGGGDANLDWWDQPAGGAGGAQRGQQAAGRGGRREGGGADAALADTWWDLSAFLKQQCAGASAFLLSGNPEATKGVRAVHLLAAGLISIRLPCAPAPPLRVP